MCARPLKTILLVEDEPDIQTVARLALETMGGYRVQLCASGEEAVVQAPSMAPDLILLDVMMPGMDGPTTLRRLREVSGLERTPVIFMTAKVQPHEVHRYRELGAIDVIAKPFDPMGLADQVEQIWRRGDGGCGDESP